jgi:hypothetical protein
VLLGLARQHEHARRHAPLPHLLQDVEAVDPGKHDVEDESGRDALLEGVQGGVAVDGLSDLEARGREGEREQRPQVGFVLNEKHITLHLFRHRIVPRAA